MHKKAGFKIADFFRVTYSLL